MNIACLLERFPMQGGVESMSHLLCTSLQNHKYSVILYAGKGDESISLNHSYKRVLVDDINSCNTFADFIIRNNIHLIINQGCYPVLTRLLENTAKLIELPPVISVLHTSPDASYKDMENAIRAKGWKARIKQMTKPLYKLYTKRTIQSNFAKINRLSSIIVLLSDTYSGLYKELYPEIERTHIKIIPNFTVPSVSTSINQKRNRIVFVGRMQEIPKKVSTVLEIWNQISSKHIDWELGLVGDGPDIDKYRAFVTSNQLQNVIFYGYRKDVDTILASSKMIILTSDYEGLPMVIIEAMKSGCVPVIYDNFLAAKDLVRNGYNGYLIEGENKTDQAVTILNHIMDNPWELDSLAKKSEILSSHFSENNIFPQWEKLINSILK